MPPIPIPVDKPIVVVDDNEADREIMSYVLADSALDNEVLYFSDGQSVIAYMEQVASGESAVPGLLLLDVNMPGKTGFEVLAWIRANPVFVAQPVIAILSSSDANKDKVQSVNLGANAFLVKDSGIQPFIASVNNAFSNEGWCPTKVA